MLDRQHLAILVEVDRQGSLTAAANRLNLTQPALSHAVRKLEDTHGVKIWNKQGRGLQLTQAGRYLLAAAQRMLPQFEQAEQALRGFARGIRGSLRIGMECHPCQAWLSRLTPCYLARWPEVDFDIRTAFRFDGIAALQGHEIDLLITPDPSETPGLVFIPASGYELVLVAPSGHPLAQRPHACPRDLIGETLITVPVGVDRLDIYTRFLLPAGCQPRQHRTIETPDLMLQLVAAGRGVAVLPDWLVDEVAAGLPVRKIPLGEQGLRKTLNLGLRSGDERIDYIRGFIDLAMQSGA